MSPIFLNGRTIRLEPLTTVHIPRLAAIGLESALWRWQPQPLETEQDMRDYVLRALKNQAAGIEIPFVIFDLKTCQVVGSTRFMDISPQNRRLEIGATWLAAVVQKTFVNTEIKLLMLSYAFESLETHKVVFKTERMNTQSCAALRRIGAVEEGVLRGHFLTVEGRPRDMVYFSVLEQEWPLVKEHLLQRYARLIE